MLETKSNLLLILVGFACLVNPGFPFVIGLIAVCGLMMWTTIKYGVPATFYAFLFFIPFTLLVRWGDPSSFLSAGFRTVWLVLYLFLYLSSGRKLTVSKNTLALIVLAALTLADLLFQALPIDQIFFVIREYMIFFCFYLIIENFLVEDKSRVKSTLLVLAISGTALAFFNVMFYTGLLNFPFQTIVVEGNNYAQRGIGALQVFRMSSILGVSAGGTAIFYTICLLVLMGYFWNRVSGVRPKLLLLGGATILILADILLISFSMITTVTFFCFAYLVSRYYKKIFQLLLVAIPSIILVFSLIEFKTAARELTLLDYILFLFEEYTVSLFSNASAYDWIVGQGFDIKTAQVERSSEIKRDFGIFSTFVSGGLPYLAATIYIIFTSIKEGLYLFRNEAHKPEIVVALGILVSTTGFLHGSPVTTRPIDYLLFVSVAIIHSLFLNVKREGIYSRSCIQG